MTENLQYHLGSNVGASRKTVILFPTELCSHHIFIATFKQCLESTPVADVGEQGKRVIAPLPQLAQNFSIFMQFSGKIVQIVGWQPRGVGAPFVKSWICN